MGRLSLRLLRFAPLIALAAAGFSAPALAQLPIQAPATPPSELGPVAPAAAPAPPAVAPGPARAEPIAPPVAVAPAAPAAVPASAPAPATAAPAPAATAPAPARAELLRKNSAEPDDEESDDEEAGEHLGPHRKWYGWQTLTIDGASFGLLLAGAGADSGGGRSNDLTSTLLLASLLGYGFGPGVVHFMHKNTGRGFASFGLRLGMPIAGAIIGAAAASGCNRFLCEADGAGVGLLAGIGGAIAIDAALLAYEDQRPERSSLGSLSPLLIVGPGRAVIGVGGAL